MKILIICNAENNTGIISSINDAWGKHLHEDGRRLKEKSKINDNSIFVVKSKAEFDSFPFEQDKPDFTFIQTELVWQKNADNLPGYEIALNLILHKLRNHFFNIQFISLEDRKDLVLKVDAKHKKLVQIFHHISFPIKIQNISFKDNNYSQLHFDLIKALILDDENRISVIEHDLDKIKNNLEHAEASSDITHFKSKLQNQVEELSILEFMVSAKLEQLQKAINKTRDKATLKVKFAEFEDILHNLKSQVTNSNNEEFSRKNKSNYKVLIIDDDLEDREFFSTTFSEIYETVFPRSKKEISDFDIRQAMQIIRSRSDYNIFVLDLLYKDRNDFWLPFNGLDLYQYVKDLNPYSCIRIITSLPRDIVSKISCLLLKTEIKISHVFTKKVGYERLKFGIYDRTLEMNIECSENEKRKTIFKPIPKLGIFGWRGVNDLVYNLMTKDNETYAKCWEEAFLFFGNFLSGNLSPSFINWNGGKLPTPKKEKSVTDSYILKRLSVIFTHRLLIINQALANKENIIDADNYETAVLKPISKIASFDKGYITTKLGFNTTPYENIQNEVSGFKIEFKNLFPEEILFIADYHKKQFNIPGPENNLIRHQYPMLSGWFYKILSDLEIYESWDELGLDFNPFINIKEINETGEISNSNIDPNLTLYQFECYLRALVKSSYNILIQKMIIQTLNLYAIRNEDEIPQHIRTLIDDLFKKE